MKWAIALILCACQSTTAEKMHADGIQTDVFRCYDDVCLDVPTGCQYLRLVDSLTPRLSTDGRPMCGTR